MADTTSLLKKIELLPDNLKAEVDLFVDFLISKSDKKIKSNHPKAGFLKGTFIVAEDFDAPLEDFKDYM